MASNTIGDRWAFGPPKGQSSVPKRKKKNGSTIVAAAMALMLATAGLALADGVQVDNDTATSGNQNIRNLTAAPGSTVNTTGQIVTSYSGSKHLAAGTSITFGIDAAQTTLPTGYTVSSASTTVPNPWSSGSFAVTSNISFAAPSTPGAYVYSVKWDPTTYTCAAGTNPADGCLSGGSALTINLFVPALASFQSSCSTPSNSFAQPATVCMKLSSLNNATSGLPLPLQTNGGGTGSIRWWKPGLTPGTDTPTFNTPFSTSAGSTTDTQSGLTDCGTWTVRAFINGMTGASFLEGTFLVTGCVATNTPPTADAGGPYTGNEGAQIQLDGSGSSDDVTIASYAWSVTPQSGGLDDPDAGATCLFVDGTLSTDESPKVSCTDDGIYDVHLTVTDDDAASDDDSTTLELENVAPDVTLNGPTSANEGDTKSYSYSFTDPGSNDTWTSSRSCGANGSISNESFSPATKSGSFDCKWTDNFVGQQVSATVNDDDSGTDTETKSVDIANVDPTTSNPQFSVNPVTGKATASFDFADVGTDDTHTAEFSWGLGDDPRTGTVTETNGAGTASDMRNLSPGCYNLTVSGTVTDDDGGDATRSIVINQQVDVYSVTFQAPIKDNERNLVKYRNVVPVKVMLTSNCYPGTTVTNENLYIRTILGSNGGIDEGVSVVSESVSNAHTGCQMRVADGKYIFNYSTYGLTIGQDYTLQVKQGTPTAAGCTTSELKDLPTVLTGVLRPKK